jgi:hypothetical protein
LNTLIHFFLLNLFFTFIYLFYLLSCSPLAISWSQRVISPGSKKNWGLDVVVFFIFWSGLAICVLFSV